MGLPERIGRYRVLGLLGQGAMGTVYRGRDEALERNVALKVMSTKHADDDARARFAREARAAARLQHPNIVTIYELGDHHAGPFMALELLEGLDLQRAIESGIKPDPRLTLPVVLQVLAGLGHAHDAGIVHRDVKPSNVFLPRDRPAKVMDFGVARLAGGTTTGGMMVGTPNYMSPEQVRAAPDLDGRSDLFSVGLILYELVTGEKAYAADTLIAVLYKIANEEPNLELIPQGPTWKRLRDVLGRALAKKPSERYADAAAMADEVAEALRDLGGKADPHFSADQILRFRGARAGKGSATSPTGTPSPVPAVRVTASPASGESQAPAPSPVWAPPAPPELRPTVAEAVILHPQHPPEEPGPRGHRGLFVALGAMAVLAFGAGLALLPRRTAAPTGVGAPVATTPARAAPTAEPKPAESHAPTASMPPLTIAPTTLPPTTTVAPSSVPTTAIGQAPTRPPSPRASASPRPATTPPTALAIRPPTPSPVPPTSTSGAPPTTPPAGAGRPGSRAASAEVLLERADALLERGQFGAAAAEAKAVLARDPGNTAAREILEEADVEIAVEGALKSARQALRDGDRAKALAEVERGLARKPTDARLTALLRQLRP